MTTQLALTQTVTQYLDRETVTRFFSQMGSSLTNHLLPNEYQAYLEVITWAVLDRLKASPGSIPASQLSEDNVKPIVNHTIKKMCEIIPQDLGYPSVMPSYLMSRVVWYSLKLCGRELK